MLSVTPQRPQWLSPQTGNLRDKRSAYQRHINLDSWTARDTICYHILLPGRANGKKGHLMKQSEFRVAILAYKPIARRDNRLDDAGAPAADVSRLLEGIGQLQHAPIVVVAPDDLDSNWQAAG